MLLYICTGTWVEDGIELRRRRAKVRGLGSNVLIAKVQMCTEIIFQDT
jgi:hypothetical protein